MNNKKNQTEAYNEAINSKHEDFGDRQKRRKKMNLYEIDKHYQEVLENGFSFDEETGEILFDTESLDQLQGEYNEKIDNIVCFVKSLEALNNAIKNEKKALDERIKFNDNKIERLKSYVSESLKQRQLKKFETSKNKLSFRKSESVNVLDESLLDKKFMKEKTTYTPDKTSIKKALKNGEEVSGAVLEVKENLQIK